MKMANEFDLDMRLLGLDMFDTTRTWPEPDQHNNALDNALRQLQHREPSFVLRGTGRHEEEYTCVLVRQGVLRGYGFVPATENTLEAIEACIKLLPPTETNAAIMRHYIENPESYNLIMLEQEAL
jgi:hypothetical protein